MLCSVVLLAYDGHSEGLMRHNLKIGRNFNKFLKNVSILPIRESETITVMIIMIHNELFGGMDSGRRKK